MAGDLRNIGPKSRAWLAEIDIHTMDQLSALGAVETYARLRFRFGKVISRNMLHALAAALAGVNWRVLSPERKAELDRQAAERLDRFNLTEI
jgi:DNA transformation protein and related proteins